MPVTKTESYSGPIDTADLHIRLDPEMREVINGNQRHQEATGKLVATVRVNGEDKCEATAVLTLVRSTELIDQAKALLRNKYGLT